AGMGCGASLLQRSEPAEAKVSPLTASGKSTRSPLTKDQINSRIVCSPKAVKAKISEKLSIQYAFVSQRGYYPDALDKPNQDCYTIIPSFNGDESKIYFGVYDGHGTIGDLCAAFAKKECPERLVKILEKKNGTFLEAYSKSFEDTNAKLHASRIDDSLSGTTAICMFLDNDMIHVANVGDSRAVIATLNEGELVAQPLSVDQTPYRSDERERVKRSGARVLTMDQLEGIAPIHDNWAPNLNDQVDEDGDPPRIWSPYGAFPGTAFTRSIGDEIAETLGVIAVPEITSLQLTEDDRFVVIASDGVFEFLTSQAVVDMVAQYEDPLEACQKVVAESYRLWLTYELRTDDITIICVYFKFSGDSLPKRNPRQQSEAALGQQQLRPVRRGMSKEKRRAQMRKDMAQLVKEEDLEYRVSDHTIPKTPEQLELLEKITKGNWLFRQLTSAQKDDIFAVMERIEVKAGDVIIKQGDPGDKFYIVESGNYQVSVRSEDDQAKESIVHTYMEKQQQENQHASFGELALMHNSPRSSSVVALSTGVLWAIDCRAFRRVFIKAPTSVLVQTLKKVDVLKTLNQSQLERLANNLSEVTFQDGDYIINQGDVGNTFYVIQEGAVICTIWEEDPVTKKKTSREVLRLKKNQYFGERALLNDAPRAANVISVGRTKLLQVGRREFEEVLGSLQEMIEADRQQREARHNFETTVKNLIYSPTVRRNSVILGPLRPQDIKFRCVVQTTDTGYLATYQGVSETNRFYTVNVISLKQVKKEKKIDEVTRYLTTHRTIRLDTPLVPEMVTTWKDDKALYVSFDTMMVTELATLLAEEKNSRFSESIARVYAAQTLLMLEYIHNAGFAYRAISSDNVLVDTKGYLQLHDFRHMKKLPDELRTYTICGTPEYMAPEMVSARGHTSSVDIWALGILLYEMLCGKTPFAVKEEGLNEKDVAMAVYSKISRHHKDDLEFPREDLSTDVMDLIRELLNPFADTRIGCQGQVDIKKGGSVIRRRDRLIRCPEEQASSKDLPSRNNMASASSKLPPPEGTRPMMISMREMETLGLKTGSGVRETVEYKIFNKTQIIEQINQIGFMCPFHEFRSDIMKMQGDELMVVADPNEVYGENWFVCVTRKAFETQMTVIQQRERERQEALEAQEKTPAAQEDDLANIVYVDKPVLARPYDSISIDDTHQEVQALSIHSQRPLYKLTVTKMSDEFNADHKFSDRDADQCFVEWRQHKDPNYELTRMEQDVGLQGIPELVDGSTQTSWFRSVNSALQYEPILMDKKKRTEEMDSEKMQAFLEKMLPLVEEALQQNETLDIFLDPFANLNEEDTAMSNKNENAIKELRSFTDLVYSKNRTLPSVDWHPKKNGVIAVAAAANVSFSKRLDLLDKIDSSFILIWNFVDLIHPQLMLEAPQDVLALRFNPLQPHIIAAGLYNGQILVWDFSKAEHLISKMKTKNSSTKGGSSNISADDEPQKQVPPVKPLYVSYIDASHRRPVADLIWLPPGVEVNNRGHLVTSTDGQVHQFVTIAGDGQVSFWDLRFKDPKYRGVTRTKVDKGAPKDAVPEVHFIPIYSITLTKVDSAGELGLKSFCFESPKEADTSTNHATFSSRFYCGTEEGEFVYADWRPHAATKSTSSSAATSSYGKDDDGAGGGGEEGVEYVQWICRDHFRPIIALCASPFFPSILLTASESNFHLWNVSQYKSSESNGPIFVSPLSLSALTCAAFSPTRPGVIYIGKADGMLEVWDFMDQSHRASLSVGVTACALTSIQFRPHVTNAPTAAAAAAGTTAATTQAANTGPNAGAKGAAAKPQPAGPASSAPTNPAAGANTNALAVKQQLVAVGDQIGNLHIMDIPRSLARASSGERQAMEAYFKRESERMKVARTEAATAVANGTTKLSSGGGHAGSGSRGEESSAFGARPTTDKDKDSLSLTSTVDDEIFKKMETEFCRELGIDTAHVASAS
ncbi:TPA: hypothetical protein N0F65_000164, partial [Lagenidium giganteum]